VISGAPTAIDLDDTAPHNGGSASGEIDIIGNYIGLDHDGDGTVGGTNSLGIQVGDADDVHIGNGAAGGRNIIAGYAATGIQVFSQANALTISANVIGTIPNTTANLSPPGDGIHVIGELGNPEAATPPVVINNTISATNDGIFDQLRDGATYQGNSIGIGSLATPLTLGNGIELRFSTGATVSQNAIGNASGNAIQVNGSETATLTGNLIGPIPALGNDGWGIELAEFGGFGAISNAVGGDDVASENVISNNALGAIDIQGGLSDDNQVLRNTGSANGGLFIDLGDDGPGATTGANGNIQPPVISSAMPSAVSGTGVPGNDVRVFAKTSNAPGEIASFVGQATVAGDGTWTVAPGANVAFVAATQTETADFGTSELSAPLAVSPDPVTDSAPDTKLDKQPKKKVKAKKKKAKVTFEFSATEPGSTFECSQDGKPFAPCTSPTTYKAKKGKHTFDVRAKDAAGNVDPTPAHAEFKVKKKKKKK
jgi:hypothetical protein